MTINLDVLAILFPLLFLLSGLGFTVVIDPYIKREHRRIMLIIVVLCLSLIAQNLGENILFVRHTNLALKNALSAYGYSVRPVFLVLFLNIIDPKGKKLLWWMLVGINAVLYCTSPFTKLCFEIRASDFASLRGPLGFMCTAVSAILLTRLLIQSVIRYRDARKWDNLLSFFVVLMIIVSVILDFNVGMEQQPVAFLTIAIVVGGVFYYIWLHLRFVREHEQDLMAAQRIQIMMSQIQPHFLFNSLNTIRALYTKDPPLADRTLENFSTYLRQNMEALDKSDLIPISKELEHTRLYAEIEAMRFANVRVEYRIEDESFMIPALTIQPLVENAIRHGVRSRKDGLVIVSTVRESGVHRITVRDNGVGFDPEKTDFTEGSHIGIRNVKDRVERMCGGSMILRSEIGKGTDVTLLIPDGSERYTKENRK